MDGYTRFLEEAGELNQTEHQVHLDNGEYVPECLYCHAEGRNRDRRNQYSEAAQALLGAAYGRNPHLTIREAQEALAQVRREAKVEALKDLADNHTIRIPDILGDKVQAVFTETIWEKLDELEGNND